LTITVQGASEHNLQEINVEFGAGLTVVTGISGSGKTSLVFDTLYHEAQRRFLEIFSLGTPGARLSPAQVREITGLGPAVAVGQNLLNRNPLSTLASASGLHPFLRLLYANFGQRCCPDCGAAIRVLSEDEIVEQVVAMSAQRPLSILAPLLRQVKGSHATLLQLLVQEFGAEALQVDGYPWQQQKLDPMQPHNLEVVVARFSKTIPPREARQAVQVAAALGAQAIVAQCRDTQERSVMSRSWTCPGCGTWLAELDPKHFHLSCPHCQGKGCSQCQETGLDPQVAAVRWQERSLPELLDLSVKDTRSLFVQIDTPSTAARLHSEIRRRLEALCTVGLGYISLNRPSPTLSRGESQRVRLAIALTSRLEDMLHILDEPTIGQHPADVTRLLPAFRQLAGPVIFVEHDRSAAATADRVIDLGPGAGPEGGRIVFTGTPAQLWQADTATGRYFSLRERVPVPKTRPAPEDFLTVRGAYLRNLQSIDLTIPLSRLTAVTGVSGSGKSTFVEDVLVASLKEKTPVGCQTLEGPALKPVLVDQSPIGRNPRSNPATYTKLSDTIRDLFATVTGLSPSHFSFNRPEGACPTCKGMGAVEVRMRYLPSTWIPCSDCDGDRFSEEVLAARVGFGERHLSIADFYQLSVEEATALLIAEERLPDSSHRSAQRILEALRDIGLGYIPLGQPSPTLSGGEAQRVKLAKYLGRKALHRQLLVLDEPSTGLHPYDIAGLLVVLDRLVRAGATIVVVEHNLDIIQAADWILDLGPGSGPDGGELLYAGPLNGLSHAERSITARALQEETSIQPRATPTADATGPDHPATIAIRDARAHNLKGVDVDIPKAALTVVTGVSGSGKSSLVGDVLEAEARRRYLESLSLYERQSTREGPEAPVASVSGLGVAITITPDRRLYNRRSTVGTATEIWHHLAVLFATIGRRACLHCGAQMARQAEAWHCPSCHSGAPIARARHFSPVNYAAACRTCNGVGSLQLPEPDKLIVHPEKPLCGGAMHSPGFFPQGYLCKPFNGGYDMVQALAQRYGFDPATTPWNTMPPEAQQAFLFGDPEPLKVVYHSRTGRTHTRTEKFPGFYGWIRDWDVGGTYTRNEACTDCQGARLRPEYLAVTLSGYSIHQLSEMALVELAQVMENLRDLEVEDHFAAGSLQRVYQRLRFLLQVGLGYLHLNRITATLSAGEAQRIKLAGMLGSGLTSLTVLLDEPSRGMHPSEVQALLRALLELRDEGNTVIVVEHDPLFMHAADHLIDMGPGAGAKGGEIVAQGKAEQVLAANSLTARWLRQERQVHIPQQRRKPQGWLTLRGARAHNLQGEQVDLPLGVLVGICGVSGSGKSTLLIDTLGRALAPRKQTTSVAYEPLDPGKHEAIEGAPARTIILDQGKRGVSSPLHFLELNKPLLRLYAESDDAQALGLTRKQLSERCTACKGRGWTRLEMGFLPDVRLTCEICQGTGHLPEAWEVRLHDLALPELYALTLNQIYELFSEELSVAYPVQAARDVGLGYLVLRQPGYALSGGEAQRLKIAKELTRQSSGRGTPKETLYILDEPTVGQHMEDVARLSGVLHRLIDEGHTAIVIEHHPHLLAACDWLMELGPGGGPDGGRLIAAGTPEKVAGGSTPSAPFLRDALEALR
jgi:excinuclease ABC subunit A